MLLWLTTYIGAGDFDDVAHQIGVVDRKLFQDRRIRQTPVVGGLYNRNKWFYCKMMTCYVSCFHAHSEHGS